jgi:hypothetical protein
VLAQRLDNLVPAAIMNIPAQLFERNVHDIVVVEFLRRDFIAELEPDPVQQVDFLRS